MKSTGLRIFDVVIVFIGLSLLAFISFDWAMEAILHSRAERQVPDLKNRSVEAALELLAPLSLSLRKEGEEFNDKVPIGAIIRQIPEAGTTVREGKAVRVVMSQGGETVFVPAVTGLPLRNAEMLFRQRQLALGEVSEAFSIRIEKGRVLSQEPQAEAPVEKNSLISVVVSGGAPPSGVELMPDFRQRPVAEAMAWAQQRGLTAEVASETQSLFPNGTVLSQEPAVDSVMTERTRLKFMVSGRTEAGGRPAAAAKTLRYELAQGSSDSAVRIVVVDRSGERELFNGVRAPGSKIELSVPDTGGAARARIFVNGILVEEREL